MSSVVHFGIELTCLHCTALCSLVWPCIVGSFCWFSRSWPCVASFDKALCDLFWSCMAFMAFLWFYMAFYGFIWQNNVFSRSHRSKFIQEFITLSVFWPGATLKEIEKNSCKKISLNKFSLRKFKKKFLVPWWFWRILAYYLIISDQNDHILLHKSINFIVNCQDQWF